MSDLTSLLMYTLNAPTWTARKLDKKATAEVKKANGVDANTDAGNFNKLLLPDCKELKAISTHIGKVRNEFYLRTAAWGDARGVRAGLVENHLDLESWFGDEKMKLVPLRDAFRDVYSAEVEKAIYLLHGMADATEYPSWDAVERKFGLYLSVQPLPNVNDIRVLKEIPQHVRDELEKNLKAEFDAVAAAATRNALEPLLVKVEHLSKQLKGYSAGEVKKLYASLTENVQTMAEAAKRLNIARDPVVDQIADEALAVVAGVTQEDLKGSEGHRNERATKAEELAAKMAKMFG